MSGEIRFEGMAREIAASVISRSGGRLPKELLPEIQEMLVDAAHDGAEYAENNLIRDNIPSGLEHYTLGYIHGLGDYDRGRQNEGGI